VPWWYWYWYAYASLVQCTNVDCSEYRWVAWTYIDPSTGRFTFTQQYWGAPLEVGSYRIFIQMPSYLPFESQAFAAAEGEDVDLGDLLVQPVPRLNSISGRLVDARTRAPINGSTTPAYVYLQGGCDWFSCAYASVAVDSNGRFRFDADQYGARLLAGSYWISAYADQYQPYGAPVDAPTANQDVDLGDLPLTSNPIRFSDIHACSTLPSTGGRCRFSVKLINGQAGVVNGTAWTEIEGWGLGSFVDSTRYTLAKQGVAFSAGTLGSSKTLTFDLDVPAGVRDGAFFCASIWFGQGANPFLGTTGQRHLFCIEKYPGWGRFDVVSDNEAGALLEKMANRTAPRRGPERMQANPPAPKGMPRGMPGGPAPASER
jgi:hypothetical protein